MASPEEYEYSAFRCAFCQALNPARKLRPIGPKIATVGDENATIASGSDSGNPFSKGQNSSTSTSEKDSGIYPD